MSQNNLRHQPAPPTPSRGAAAPRKSRVAAVGTVIAVTGTMTFAEAVANARANDRIELPPGLKLVETVPVVIDKPLDIYTDYSAMPSIKAKAGQPDGASKASITAPGIVVTCTKCYFEDVEIHFVAPIRKKGKDEKRKESVASASVVSEVPLGAVHITEENDTQGYAIAAFGDAKLKLTNCLVDSVLAADESSLMLNGSTIANSNVSGVFIADHATLDAQDCEIYNHDEYGIVNESQGECIIGDTKFHHAGLGQVYVHPLSIGDMVGAMSSLNIATSSSPGGASSILPERPLTTIRLCDFEDSVIVVDDASTNAPNSGEGSTTSNNNNNNKNTIKQESTRRVSIAGVPSPKQYTQSHSADDDDEHIANRGDATLSRAAVFVCSYAQLVFERNSVHNSVRHGVLVDGDSRAMFDRNLFSSNGGVGVVLRGAEDLTDMRSNSFHANNLGGLAVLEGAQARVAATDFSGRCRVALRVDGPGSRATLKEVAMRRGDVGVLVSRHGDVRMKDMQFEGMLEGIRSDWLGVFLVEGSTNFADNELSINMLHSSTGRVTKARFSVNHTAIAIKSNALLIMKECELRNSDTAVDISDGGRGHFEKNLFNESRTCDMVVSRHGRPFVTDNTFSKCGANALYIKQRGRGCYINNTFAETKRAAIRVDTRGDPEVYSNVVTASETEGLLVTDEGLGTYVDNVFTDCTSGGVAVRTRGTPTLRHNHITNNGSLGVEASLRGCGLIEKNYIYDNESMNVFMKVVSAEGLCFRGNVVEGSTTGVFCTERGDGTWYRNVIRGAVTGVQIECEGNPLLLENSIENVTEGIVCASGGLGIIACNIVKRCISGIVLTLGSAPRVFNNIFTENRQYGCSASQYSRGQFYQNIFSNNAVAGVLIRNADTKFLDNVICKNGVGVMSDAEGVGHVARSLVSENKACGFQLSSGTKLSVDGCAVLNQPMGIVVTGGARVDITRCFVAGCDVGVHGTGAETKLNLENCTCACICILRDSVKVTMTSTVHIPSPSAVNAIENMSILDHRLMNVNARKSATDTSDSSFFLAPSTTAAAASSGGNLLKESNSAATLNSDDTGTFQSPASPRARLGGYAPYHDICGIHVGTNAVLMMDNSVCRRLGVGVMFADGTGTCVDCTFRDCHIGAVFLGTVNSTLSECVLYRSQACGVLLTKQCRGTVQSCHVLRSGGAGIVVSGNATARVLDCDVYQHHVGALRMHNPLLDSIEGGSSSSNNNNNNTDQKNSENIHTSGVFSPDGTLMSAAAAAAPPPPPHVLSLPALPPDDDECRPNLETALSLPLDVTLQFLFPQDVPESPMTSMSHQHRNNNNNNNRKKASEAGSAALGLSRLTNITAYSSVDDLDCNLDDDDPPTAGFGLVCTRGGACEISRCRFFDNARGGAFCTQSADPLMKDNIFTKAPYGIVCAYGGGGAYAHNRFYGHTRAGLLCTANSKGTFDSNMFWDQPYGALLSWGAMCTLQGGSLKGHTIAAVRVWGNGAKPTICKNQIGSNHYGCVVAGRGASPVVEGNVFESNAAGGVVCGVHATTVINGNTFSKHVATAAVSMFQQAMVFGEHSTFSDNNIAVLSLTGARANMKGNEFCESREAAVVVDRGGLGFFHKNNFSKTSGTHCVVVQRGANPSFEECQFYAEPPLLIHLDGAGTYKKNDFKFCRTCAFEIKNFGNPTIEGHTYMNQKAPFVLAWHRTLGRMVGNFLFGQDTSFGVAASIVSCVGDKCKFIIEKNVFAGFRDRAIQIQDGAAPELIENVFAHNACGIDSSSYLTARENHFINNNVGVYYCGGGGGGVVAVLEGNTFEGSTDVSVQVSKKSTLQLIDSIFFRGLHGVRIAEGSNKTHLKGNHFLALTGLAIDLCDTAGAHISQAVMSGCADGIQVRGIHSRVVLDKCDLRRITRSAISCSNSGRLTATSSKIRNSGVGLEATLSSEVTLKNSEVFGCTKGILATANGNPTCANCTISNNTIGVFIGTDGLGTFSFNTIRANEDNIMCTSGTPMLPLFSKNHICDSTTGAGVVLLDSAMGVFRENLVYDNATAGVVSSGDASTLLDSNKIWHPAGTTAFVRAPNVRNKQNTVKNNAVPDRGDVEGTTKETRCAADPAIREEIEFLHSPDFDDTANMPREAQDRHEEGRKLLEMFLLQAKVAQPLAPAEIAMLKTTAATLINQQQAGGNSPSSTLTQRPAGGRGSILSPEIASPHLKSTTAKKKGAITSGGLTRRGTKLVLKENRKAIKRLDAEVGYVPSDVAGAAKQDQKQQHDHSRRRTKSTASTVTTTTTTTQHRGNESDDEQDQQQYAVRRRPTRLVDSRERTSKLYLKNRDFNVDGELEALMEINVNDIVPKPKKHGGGGHRTLRGHPRGIRHLYLQDAGATTNTTHLLAPSHLHHGMLRAPQPNRLSMPSSLSGVHQLLLRRPPRRPEDPLESTDVFLSTAHDLARCVVAEEVAALFSRYDRQRVGGWSVSDAMLFLESVCDNTMNERRRIVGHVWDETLGLPREEAMPPGRFLEFLEHPMVCGCYTRELFRWQLVGAPDDVDDYDDDDVTAEDEDEGIKESSMTDDADDDTDNKNGIEEEVEGGGEPKEQADDRVGLDVVETDNIVDDDDGEATAVV
eukprot:PhM_4_TR16951/c0_g2_i1/m.74468